MNARDLMTEDPMTVDVRTAAREALAAMGALEVRHLPVVGANNQLLGMLSDRDFRSATAAQLDAPVGDLMTSDPLSVGPEADAVEVIDLMIDNKVGAVPVVEGDELLGIISYVDVLRELGHLLSSEG